MKSNKSLLLISCLLLVISASAQNRARVLLSDTLPKRGEKIQLSINVSGISNSSANRISATVFFMDNKNYPAVDIDLKREGTSLKGDFIVDTAANAFFIKIAANEVTDNNNDKGYVYLVYKDKKPVPGAYAAKAEIFTSDMVKYLAAIPTDRQQALALFQKESETNPQLESVYQSKYCGLLAAPGDEQSKAVLSIKLNKLLRSDNEADLNLAAFLLPVVGRKAEADTLTAVIKKRFPHGKLVENDYLMAFYQQRDVHKRDSIYTVFAANFPQTPDQPVGMRENLMSMVATGYLAKGDLDGFYKIANQMKDKWRVSGNMSALAQKWAEKNQRLTDAEALSRQAMDFSAENVKHPEGVQFATVKMVEQIYKPVYYGGEDTYGFILYIEKKYTEALKYQQDAYNHNEENDPLVNEHYALTLAATGDYARSKMVIEKAIKEGKSSDGLKALLKKDFTQLKGNDAGFDRYLSVLENNSKVKLRTDLAKREIEKPAPPFSLLDLQGNKVSLASLKGKIVVLDFWANWCIPCKASFPGMQATEDKFKNNPNMVFLFIDCLESGNYVEVTKKYLAETKYTFQVIFDEKATGTRTSKTVESYDVTGIPTKFIIDKKGNIRFKMTDEPSTPKGLVDEISTMINIVEDEVVAPGLVKTNAIKN